MEILYFIGSLILIFLYVFNLIYLLLCTTGVKYYSNSSEIPIPSYVDSLFISIPQQIARRMVISQNRILPIIISILIPGTIYIFGSVYRNAFIKAANGTLMPTIKPGYAIVHNNSEVTNIIHHADSLQRLYKYIERTESIKIVSVDSPIQSGNPLNNEPGF